MLSFDHLLHIFRPSAGAQAVHSHGGGANLLRRLLQVEVNIRRDVGRRGMMMMAVMSMALAVTLSVALRIGWAIVAE
jgi:hypothetical protein